MHRICAKGMGQSVRQMNKLADCSIVFAPCPYHKAVA